MAASAAMLDLPRNPDGAAWPLHEHSRRVCAGGLQWHLQELGAGPECLLVHGAGSSLHSWHRLLPLLAKRWRVLALDLPGHGFTQGRPERGMSLQGMTQAVGALLRELQVQPSVAVGHSAGAAVVTSLALDRLCAPRALFSLNGALVPFDRRYDLLFAPLARVFAALPLVPELLSWHARDRSAVERLIASTGSQLEPAEIDFYWRLMRNPRHVAGVLQMMSEWSVQGLVRRLPQLATPLIQLVGSRDATVPPSAAEQVRELLPSARTVMLQGLGHLAHEERPDRVAKALFDECDRLGI